MNDKDNYIKDLFEDLKYSISKFDNQALVISGGALGFSLTFIKDIVPFSEAIYVWLLYSSLFCFIYTIGIGFFGHYLSLKQISNSIEIVSNEKYNDLKPDKWIPKINLSIVISLSLGILLMVGYCLINIQNLRNNKKMKQHQIEIKKTIPGGQIEINGNVNSFIYSDSTNSKININSK